MTKNTEKKTAEQIAERQDEITAAEREAKIEASTHKPTPFDTLFRHAQEVTHRINTGRDEGEARDYIAVKIVADKLAGVLHEQLHGTMRIKRDHEGAPLFDTDGKVMIERDNKNAATTYLMDAFDRMEKVVEQDANGYQMETALERYTSQKELVDALQAMKQEMVSLYIAACGSANAKWQPYVQRLATEMEEKKAAGGTIDTDAGAKDRKAKAKEEIAALLRKGTMIPNRAA